MSFDILRLSRLLCLVLSLLFFTGTALGQDNESSIFAFTDADCSQRPRPRQPGTPDGACQKITTVNATSLTIAKLGHGCTITAYTDENCSNDATAIRENQCTSIGAFFLAFSVDNCTPNPPTTSLSTRIRPLTTSTSSRSSTSASSPTTDLTTTGPTTTDPSNIDSNPPLSSTTSTPSSSSGISTGAKVGIAVGVTVGVLLIAGLLIRYFFFPRRPSTPPVAPDHTAADPTDPDKKRGFWLFARRKPSYMFPPPPAELGGSYPDQEETTPGARPARSSNVYELSAAQFGELPAARGSAEETK